MSDARQEAANFYNNMKDKGSVSVEVAASLIVIINLLDEMAELEKDLAVANELLDHYRSGTH